MVKRVWTFDHTILLYLFGYLIYFYYWSHLESELQMNLRFRGFLFVFISLFSLLFLLEEKGSEKEKNNVLFFLWAQSINLEWILFLVLIGFPA